MGVVAGVRPAVEVRGADITPLQEASFWSLVKLSLTGCWEWQSTHRTEAGYGRFKVGDSRVGAHRVAYAICYGCAPADALVRHRCDNPKCVRPDHLVLGDPADNADDRRARGRTARGAGAGGALLTDEAVRDIRTRRIPQRAFAALYGVSKSAVGKVQTGANWSWLS